MINRESDLKLSENIYITLTDHISMSLEREKKGVVLKNPFLLEIKQFYKQEYALARQAAGIIKKHLGLDVSDDEVGTITLHIVNACRLPRQRVLLLVKLLEMCIRDRVKSVQSQC